MSHWHPAEYFLNAEYFLKIFERLISVRTQEKKKKKSG
jgi:hypothetical protein